MIFIILVFTMMILILSIFLNFNPLILSIFFICYVILLTMNLCIMENSNFYSFILFMSMISGLMIIFMYFSSLNNDNKIYFNYKNKLFILIFYMMLFFILYMIFKMNYLNYLNYNLNNLSMNMKMNNSNNQIYYFPEMKLMMFMISFLLISLMCIIKICSMKNYPLRSFKM